MPPKTAVGAPPDPKGVGSKELPAASPPGTAGSRSHAAEAPASARSAQSSAATPRRALVGVAMPALMRFVFPQHLEHPESTGRLELFASCGPADEEGHLRGGIGGSHIHTDFEIRQMIAHNTKEALFTLFKRPRDQVEVLVEGLLPHALEAHATRAEVKKILRDVPTCESGRMSFNVLQDKVLANQRERLQALMKDHQLHGKKERGPKIPFQSKQAEALLAVTHKKKLVGSEEDYAMVKRRNAYTSLLSTLADQRGLADQLSNNVMICRHPGDVSDRWDRYCAVRRTGRSGYVQTRNHFRKCADDGLADKHPGVSSLVATMGL